MNWLGIRARVILIAVVPVLFVTAVLLTVSLAERLEATERDLVDRGRSMANQLAVGSEYGLFAGNIDFLDNALAGVLREPVVVGGIIRDADGRAVVSGGELSARSDIRPPPAVAVTVERRANRILVIQHVRQGAGAVDDLFALDDKNQASRLLGVVELQLSLDALREERRQIINAGLQVAAMALSLAILLALWVGRSVTVPLRRISAAVARIGAGDLSARVPPPEPAGDMGRLASGVNAMATQLALSRADLQLQIDLATRELADKKNEAERANEAKTRFLAAASHDLRQPLHALSLFIDQLLRCRLTGEAGHLSMRIAESADVLGTLLNALLDISRLDAGALVPQPRRCALQPVLDRIALDFGGTAAQKGLQLCIRPTDVWVETDPTLAERILMNLVGNALRYTASGTVLVAARKRANRVRIEVRDSGPGIPAEAQQLIFSEFVQLSNPERDHRKGLGLGLSIVRRMCALLSHPMGLRSVPGRGSVFWIEMPRVAAQLPAERNGGRVSDGKPAQRVLIIDDEVISGGGLVDLLADWGYEALRVSSGDEALQVLFDEEFLPAAVICNQRLLSGESGQAAVARVRERLGDRLPAIMLTAEDDPRVVNAAAGEHFLFLGKPLRPAKLRAALNGLFRED